jgi:N-methylhydantoinase A
LFNLRVTVIGLRPKFDLSLLAPDPAATLAGARQGRRPVHADGEWHDAEIYDRLALPVGASVAGPAILEQPDATIFVEPGFEGQVDRLGNFIMARRA